MSIGLLLSVVGFAVLAASRAATRQAALAADADEAASLAESGVEWGLACVASDQNWRTTYTHDVERTGATLGRGRMSFKLVSDAGSSLTSGDVRLVGIGRVGSASRAYSVKLTGVGSTLEVLSTAAHSAAAVSVTAALNVSGGSLSTNKYVNVSSGITLTGSVEEVEAGTGGTVTGGRTTLSSSRQMPSDVFDSYRTQATTIAYASIASGQISKKVLSAASNPYGATSSSGIYYIKVESPNTLTITNSRLVATLVVELAAGAKLVTSGAFAWDPARADLPALIVKSTGSATVTLGGSSSTLSETSNFINYNPSGTPNASGVSDTDTSDTYPAEFHGLLHVIGSGVATTMQANFAMKGVAILDGPLTTSTGVKLTYDPTIAANPPSGYTAATKMYVSPGTWNWVAVSR